MNIEIQTGEKNAYTHYPSKYKIEMDGKKEEFVGFLKEFKKRLSEVLERIE